MSFDVITLGDLLGEKGYIRGPFGSALKRSELKDEGIPVYEQQHAIRGDREFRFFIDENKYKQLKRFTVKSNDLIISCSGTVGRISIIDEGDPKGIISQALLILRPDTEKISSQFLYYFLTSKKGFNELINASQGAVQLNIAPRAVVEKIPVPTPSTEVQQRIVYILRSLDNKIALNRQINQILESMAQAIFKSWFVDFDPVKAKIAALESGEDAEGVTRAAMRAISGKTDDELDKMEGGQPENYAKLKTTAGLFPSAMQETELGEVPEGWGVMPLDKIAHYQNGLALQKFRPENEDEYLPVLKIAQLKKGFADGVEKASVNIKPECIVDNGDVIFSWSGSLMVDIWCSGKVALNQHLFKVISEKYPKWFYYYWTKHHLSEFQRIASAKAVTMGHIKREHLSSAMCTTPCSQILESASKTIECIVGKSIEVRLENFMLLNLRDILLPKLLSGELSVDAIKTTNEHGE